MKKLGAKDLMFYAVVIGIVFVVIYMFTQLNKVEQPAYGTIRQLFKQEKVTEVEIVGSDLTIVTKDGQKLKHELYSVTYFREDLNDIINDQMDRGIIKPENVKYEVGFVQPWWAIALPYLFILVVFVALWYFMMGRAGGGGGNPAMNFKRANARLAGNEKKKISFADVEGAKEEKEELSEIVEFLKNPRRFVELGARIPKGVLLVGPPGTGKTLLAKAVAGEAGVQFLSISGSDFVELYVGVGASRVRSLFEEAKKLSPAIIFIDEIDAVGRHRGAGMGGGHDEREQTLNQLLVEMDGFANNEGVIVLAATNRADILDPALLRPGRFDRQVYVGYPDIKGREAILKLHAKGKPLDIGVDLSVIAKTTTGFTGADLENLLNEAALLAARASHRVIMMDDVHEAMIKVIAGPEKRSKVVSDKERKLTAYHEAGHAVVMYNLEHADPVHQITIIPRGMAGGMTISLPAEDKSFMSKSEMFEDIVSFLGGRVAEKLILDDISTGASSDIKRATRIARNMVTKYGMSDELGPINFGSESDEVFLGRDYGHTKNYSEEIASKIDSEIKRFIDRAYDDCERILAERVDKLHGVASFLLENEIMDSATFERYMKTGEYTEPEPEPA